MAAQFVFQGHFLSKISALSEFIEHLPTASDLVVMNLIFLKATRFIKIFPQFVILMLIPMDVWATGPGPVIGGKDFVLTLGGMFAILWVIVWLIIKFLFKKYKHNKYENIYWLLDNRIPIGLRLLSVVQYFSSFICFFSSILFLFGGSSGNNYIMVSLWTIGLLLIITANGYINRSERFGFNGGIILSLVCLINSFLYHHFISFTREIIFYIGPFYGLLLLCLLIWRYEDYFKGKEI